MPLPDGTRLGPYQIVAPLGAGGMGELYRARNTRLDRDVAVKVLHSTVRLDPDRRRRFELEARAAGALNHPNIVAIFDIGSENGLMYVVEELLEGETLRERLRRGPLPARKAIDYAVQVAHGLAAAHAKGIVHRDVKPENLFLTRDGLKILDFGLAKLKPAKPSADASRRSDRDTRDRGRRGARHHGLHVAGAGARSGRRRVRISSPSVRSSTRCLRARRPSAAHRWPTS